jgi:hypothetical protein
MGIGVDRQACFTQLSANSAKVNRSPNAHAIHVAKKDFHRLILISPS